MATANNLQIDPIAAAMQALAEAKQELAAAEQKRATAVVKANHLLDTAIAMLNAAQGTAGTAVKAQYADGVSGAKQTIAEVTTDWDERIKRAKNTVEAAKKTLALVLLATLKGVQDTATKQAVIASITDIATNANLKIETTDLMRHQEAEINALKCNQEAKMNALKRNHEAEMAKLVHDHATMLKAEKETARQHAAALEAERIKLEEQLKQLELD